MIFIPLLYQFYGCCMNVKVTLSEGIKAFAEWWNFISCLVQIRCLISFNSPSVVTQPGFKCNEIQSVTEERIGRRLACICIGNDHARAAGS